MPLKTSANDLLPSGAANKSSFTHKMCGLFKRMVCLKKQLKNSLNLHFYSQWNQAVYIGCLLSNLLDSRELFLLAKNLLFLFKVLCYSAVVFATIAFVHCILKEF